MDCKEFENLLDDYLDGDLSPAGRAAFDEHAERCPRCGRLRDESLTVRNMLRAELVPHTPEGLSAIDNFKRELENSEYWKRTAHAGPGEIFKARRLVYIMGLFLLISLIAVSVYAAEYYSLKDALGDTDRDVRSEAAKELGVKIWDPELMDVLNEALVSNDPKVRASAAEALGLIVIKAKGMGRLLVYMLEDKDINVRLKAVDALREIGPPPEALPVLVEKLRSGSNLACSVLAYEIGNLAQRDANWVQETITMLLDDLKFGSPGVRTKAADALGRIGPRQGVTEALVEALGDEDKFVRSAAAISLGSFGTRAAVVAPELTKLLNDDDSDVRIFAATALGLLGPLAGDAVPELINLYEEETINLGGKLPDKPAPPSETSKVFDVRGAIVNALGRIGVVNDDVIPTLTKALRDHDPDLRHFAAQALGKIGPDAAAAVPALIEAVWDDVPDVRLYAITALGFIGPAAEEAIPVLIKILGDVNEDAMGIRRWAAFALRDMGPDPRIISALIEAVDDESDVVRSMAVDAFRVIGTNDERAAAALVNALEDEDGMVRCLAARALSGNSQYIDTAVSALVNLLDADSLERARAARTLGDIGPDAKAALPEIREIFADKNAKEPDRLAAAYALARIADDIEHTLPIIIKALAHEEYFIRLNAADYIGKIGPEAKDAVPALIMSLGLGQSQMTQRCITALGEIGAGAESALPILRAIAAQGKWQETREAALEAIAKIEEALDAEGATPAYRGTPPYHGDAEFEFFSIDTVDKAPIHISGDKELKEYPQFLTTQLITCEDRERIKNGEITAGEFEDIIHQRLEKQGLLDANMMLDIKDNDAMYVLKLKEGKVSFDFAWD